jgi:VWFA-related protein
MQPVRLTITTLLVLAAGSLSASEQSPPQTTFRSGVDLVLLDVTVLDKDGRQISDLQARDFSIEVGGKKRALVAAQFVQSGKRDAVAASGSAPANAATGTPPAFTNAVATLASEARTIFVVVDVENIRSGEGRGAMETLAEYFETLPPTDQIGFISLPSGTPSLEPTTDRAAVKSVLSRTVGLSGQVRSCDPTFGEAAAFAADDYRALPAYGERAAGLACGPIDARSRLNAAIPAYRQHTLNLLRNVASFAGGLSERPGRRSIILVSEGLYSDDKLVTEIAKFGEALERARVVIHAIHLDFPFGEAVVKGSISQSRKIDDEYGLGAMADVAIAAGGEAIRAVSRATPALRRIDAALSGSYVLAFERAAGDTDGKRLSVKINVNRSGADVRARSHVTIAPKASK